ncbi:hypothetical protein ACLOJK_017986 [Asimina triloba]
MDCWCSLVARWDERIAGEQNQVGHRTETSCFWIGAGNSVRIEAGAGGQIWVLDDDGSPLQSGFSTMIWSGQIWVLDDDRSPLQSEFSTTIWSRQIWVLDDDGSPLADDLSMKTMMQIARIVDVVGQTDRGVDDDGDCLLDVADGKNGSGVSRRCQSLPLLPMLPVVC